MSFDIDVRHEIIKHLNHPLFRHQTTLDLETNLYVLHTNCVHLRTSFDQAVEQAEAMRIDHTNEFENCKIVQSIKI